jgi:hypothetical protein
MEKKSNNLATTESVVLARKIGPLGPPADYANLRIAKHKSGLRNIYILQISSLEYLKKIFANV